MEMFWYSKHLQAESFKHVVKTHGLADTSVSKFCKMSLFFLQIILRKTISLKSILAFTDWKVKNQNTMSLIKKKIDFTIYKVWVVVKTIVIF